MTIKIKAPRVPCYPASANGPLKEGTPLYGDVLGWRDDAVAGRWISESTYRRILALVRACENDEPLPPLIGQAIDKLKAQCEKENAK